MIKKALKIIILNVMVVLLLPIELPARFFEKTFNIDPNGHDMKMFSTDGKNYNELRIMILLFYVIIILMIGACK